MTTREELRTAAAAEVDRWEKQLSDELARLFDRQQAVVLVRLQGTKARKHTRHWEPAGDRPFEVKAVIDVNRWTGDAASAAGPIVRRLMGSVYRRVSTQVLEQVGGALAEAAVSRLTDSAIAKRLEDAVTERLGLIAKGVETAVKEVHDFIARAEADGTPMPDMVKGVSDLYAGRSQTWADRIAAVSAVGSINVASLMAAQDLGCPAKQWLSRRDAVVRDTHEDADGQKQPLMSRFQLGGFDGHPACELLFPGDPSPGVPLSEIMNCRCTLLFQLPGEVKAGFLDLEVKDRVRTPAGAAAYGQPIGSVIRRDPVAAPSFSAGPTGSGSAPAASRAPRARGARVLGQLEGSDVVDVTGSGEALKVAAKHEGVQRIAAHLRMVALQDSRGRINAYVLYQGPAGRTPGKVESVSVSPRLKGRKVGDRLVAMIAADDPAVTPTTRQAPGTPPATTRPAPGTPPAAARQPSGPKPITDHSQPGDAPGTSGDFDADALRIDRLQKAYLGDRVDTTSLYSRGGRWSRDREKKQQEVIDHFLNAPGVKADRQIFISGGLPGAGKTTFINSAAGQQSLGLDLNEFVTVNADEVKAEMIKRGMVPDYPGLSPEESATMYHAESFEVAHSLMRQAAKQGKNFAYDTTLKTTGQVGFTTAAAGRTTPPPWTTTMLFVDIDVDTAKTRAKARYLGGDRYLPLGYIDGLRGRSGGTSRPAENFEVVKGDVAKWVRVDNSGTAPVVTATGGKRRKAATSSPTATPVAPSTPPAKQTAPPVGASAAPAVPAGLPTPPAGATVFAHPSGKHIYVLPGGGLEVWKPGGKKGVTSATGPQLMAGYGSWKRVDAGSAAGPTTTGTAPTLVASPKAPPVEQPSAPAPAYAAPIVKPMDFNEAQLSDVPRYIADPDYVFQQKIDGIRGVLVVEAGKQPWFASKKGERLVSSTAAKITGPMLAKLPATPAGSPSYRVEGELLDGKFHVFDMVVDGQEALDYETRLTMAETWVDSVAPALPGVSKLPVARTAAEKQALWDAVQNSGAEGVMMKRRDAGYQGGARVSHTLKAKITATADVVILAKGKDGKANVEMGLSKGGQVVSIGTVSALGKGQLDVGDVVEVEYLWASAGDSLAQPRIVRKRPDKTPADITDLSQLRRVDKTVVAIAAKALRIRLEQKVAG